MEILLDTELREVRGGNKTHEELLLFAREVLGKPTGELNLKDARSLLFLSYAEMLNSDIPSPEPVLFHYDNTNRYLTALEKSFSK